MNARVEKLDLTPGARVLAVSDIHANWRFLDHLLTEANFGPQDTLVILGDILEKGYQNLDTLRYVMRLMKENANVRAVLGNCDNVTLDFLDWDDDCGDGYFPWYLNLWKGRSLITELAAQAGLPVWERRDFPAVRELLRREYGGEIAFLRSLPTILESRDVIFVHGGVPSELGMEQLDAWNCMKNDDFLSQDTHLNKWCVVGHWPVTLYREKIPSPEPIVCREKYVVCIDGGCSLKPDGQLNLLSFHAGDRDFSWISYDGLPQVTALEAQQASEDSINIRWHDAVVEVLEEGEEFCRCRHLTSGRVLDILTRYLYRRDGKTVCEDSTDYHLSVAPGDRLHVVEYTSRGLLVKNKGVTGWYGGKTAEG